MQPRPPELARFARIDGAAEDLHANLHAVADAQDRDAQIEDGRVALGGVALVDAGRPAREDDALGVQGFELFSGDVRANQLAVNPFLTDSSGDELGVLRAEIEDRNDFLVLHAK